MDRPRLQPVIDLTKPSRACYRCGSTRAKRHRAPSGVYECDDDRRCLDRWQTTVQKLARKLRGSGWQLP